MIYTGNIFCYRFIKLSGGPVWSPDHRTDSRLPHLPRLPGQIPPQRRLQLDHPGGARQDGPGTGHLLQLHQPAPNPSEQLGYCSGDERTSSIVKCH